jgi:hypothetical protein
MKETIAKYLETLGWGFENEEEITTYEELRNHLDQIELENPWLTYWDYPIEEVIDRIKKNEIFFCIGDRMFETHQFLAVEEKDSITKETFLNDLECGWDYAMETLRKDIEVYIDSIVFKEKLLNEIDHYFYAYKYCKNNDIDDGKCFKKREEAIQNIIRLLDSLETN